MATTNYNIEQPLQDDFYNIDIINDNMAIIDEALNTLEKKKLTLESAIADTNKLLATLSTTLDNVELALAEDVVLASDVSIKTNVTWGDLCTKTEITTR